MRRWAIVLLLVHGPAFGQFAVFDPVDFLWDIVNAYDEESSLVELGYQLQAMRDQYDELTEQFDELSAIRGSMSGPRDIAHLFMERQDARERRFAPDMSDWSWALPAGGNVGGDFEAAGNELLLSYALTRESADAVYEPVNYRFEGAGERWFESATNAAGGEALAILTFERVGSHMAQVDAYLDALSSSNDMKSSLDLQLRGVGFQAELAAENARLDAAQLRAEADQTLEAEAAHGRVTRLFRFPYPNQR